MDAGVNLFLPFDQAGGLIFAGIGDLLFLFILFVMFKPVIDEFNKNKKKKQAKQGSSLTSPAKNKPVTANKHPHKRSSGKKSSAKKTPNKSLPLPPRPLSPASSKAAERKAREVTAKAVAPLKTISSDQKPAKGSLPKNDLKRQSGDQASVEAPGRRKTRLRSRYADRAINVQVENLDQASPLSAQVHLVMKPEEIAKGIVWQNILTRPYQGPGARRL
ncbi:MAG: hypothetical protein E7K64_03215 [Clostridia bacterium]|nr:hypothetical protein [Peptococcus niger]MDU7244334.1 hypothetical protein [Clostridiales bacterium]MDU7505041.1 hypothetical protein [Clostridia bacterium]